MVQKKPRDNGPKLEVHDKVQIADYVHASPGRKKMLQIRFGTVCGLYDKHIAIDFGAHRESFLRSDIERGLVRITKEADLK